MCVICQDIFTCGKMFVIGVTQLLSSVGNKPHNHKKIGSKHRQTTFLSDHVLRPLYALAAWAYGTFSELVSNLPH